MQEDSFQFNDLETYSPYNLHRSPVVTSVPVTGIVVYSGSTPLKASLRPTMVNYENKKSKKYKETEVGDAVIFTIMSKTGYTCIRYVFCAVNIFLWLAGCGLLGLGAWLHYARQGRNSLLPQHAWAGGDIALIAIGAAIFVVTFFGCCGSCYQSKCMLVTYFVLVIIMFLFEFLIATFAFVYREQIHQTVQDEFLHGIENHYQYPDNGLDEIWDRIHTNLHCCGMKNYEDWYEIKSWPEERRVPESCCLPQFSNSTDCFKESNQDKWYDKGCSEKLQMWLVSQLHLVGIVGLVVSFIQLFGLISAMLLFCTDREKRTKGHIYQPAV